MSTPLSKPKGAGTWDHARRLTYMESEDGVHWRRPRLPFVSWEGHKETNILIDVWASYASVDIDADRAWPYEMFLFCNPRYGLGSGRIAGLPLPEGEKKHPYGLYRFHSKDGKDWKAVEGPIALKTTDSCFICQDFRRTTFKDQHNHDFRNISVRRQTHATRTDKMRRVQHQFPATSDNADIHGSS